MASSSPGTSRRGRRDEDHPHTEDMESLAKDIDARIHDVKDTIIAVGSRNCKFKVYTGQHREDICHLRQHDGSAASTKLFPSVVTEDAIAAYNSLKSKVTQRINKKPKLVKRLKTSLDRSSSYRIPEEDLGKVETGEQLLQVLEECCLLSPNNILYLQHLLNSAELFDIAKEVEIYGQNKNSTIMYIKPVKQSRVKGAFRIETEMAFEGLDNLDANAFVTALEEQLDIPPSVIHIIGAVKESFTSVTLVVQLPMIQFGEDVRNRLNEHITQNQVPEWIETFNVFGIHIETMHYVVFERLKTNETHSHTDENYSESLEKYIDARIHDAADCTNALGSRFRVCLGQHKAGYCHFRQQDGNATSRKLSPGVGQKDAIAAYNSLKSKVTQHIKGKRKLLKQLKYSSDNTSSCKIPKNHIDKVKTAEQLLEALEECCLLSPNNVSYLHYLLLTIGETSIAEEVKIYEQKKDSNILHIKPVKQSRVEGAFRIEIEMAFEDLDNLDTNGFVTAFGEQQDIPNRLIHIIGVVKESVPSVTLVIQLPNQKYGEEVRDQLYEQMTQNQVPEWIVTFNVFGIHIEDMHYVVFKKLQKSEADEHSGTDKEGHNLATEPEGEADVQSDTDQEDFVLASDAKDEGDVQTDADHERFKLASEDEAHHVKTITQSNSAGDLQNVQTTDTKDAAKTTERGRQRTKTTEEKSLPQGITKTDEEGVRVIFHTIVSPDFKFEPERHEVAVRMGGDDFGNFEIDCACLKYIREIAKGYFEVSGEVRVKCKALRNTEDGIPYIYIVKKKHSSDNPEYEMVYTDPEYYRSLCIQPAFQENNAVWEQYDSVMGKNKQETFLKKTYNFGKKAFNFFRAREDDKTHVTVDRHLLTFKAYLPKWEGFVTNGVAMDAVKAMEKLENVCERLNSATVMTARVLQDNRPLKLPKYPLEKLLGEFLSDKIDTFSEGSNIDKGACGYDDIKITAARIKSALAILYLIDKYKVDIATTQNLFEGLRMSNIERDCQDHVVDLISSIKKEFGIVEGDSEYVVSLQKRCNDALQKGQSEWIHALPLLHFLRQDCQPFEVLPYSENHAHLKREWWGMKWLSSDTLTHFEGVDMEVVIKHIPLQFQIDPLLERSVVWLQLRMEEIGTVPKSDAKHPILPKTGVCAQTLACGLHHIVRTLEKSRMKIQHLTPWIQTMIDRLSNDFLQSVSEEEMIMLTAITKDITSCIVKFFSKTHEKYPASHSLLLQTCHLFGQCYSKIARSSSSQEMLTSTKEFGYANTIMHDMKSWLVMYLPQKLTKDGENLLLEDEFKILTGLLDMAPLFSGLQWNEQWKNVLKDRFKELPLKIAEKVFQWDQLWDPDKCNSSIIEVLCEVVIDSIGKKDTGLVDRFFITIGTRPKDLMANLLSKVVNKDWPSKTNDNELLKHILTSPLIPKCLELPDDRLSVLNDDARRNITIARSCLQKMYREMLSGSITIERFKFISKHEQLWEQFVLLFEIFKAEFKASQSDLNTCIRIRRKELQFFQREIERNKKLVSICQVGNVDINTSNVTADLVKAKKMTLKLTEVCNPLDVKQMSTVEYEPRITFFKHSLDVQAMLHPLTNAAESLIFRTLWSQRAQSISGRITVDDVESKIWRVVLEQMKSIYNSVSNASIKLAVVDELFRDFKQKEPIKQELLKVAKFLEYQNTDWIDKRTTQIVEYRQVQFQSDMASHMLAMQEALELDGDFQALVILSQMRKPHFKSKPLSAIEESVITASRAIEHVSGKQLRCLEEAAKALKFIKWIRNEIKDVNQLKVFVDLAIIQAGETDLEIDRVWCFHGAAMGYAPIIFELSRESGCKELLLVCKKVWAALENDPEMPLKLRDAKKYIHWLRGVNANQGSGEMSSISQLEVINSRGRYIIGKLPKTAKAKRRNLDDANLILIVKGSKGEGMATYSEDRIYTIDELRDLQGKLNLVVGKKQKQGAQAQIENFIEVFTIAQQLADYCEKLLKAGCLLFSEWKLTLYCQRLNGRVSVHVDVGVESKHLLAGTNALLKELEDLREFMNDCLKDWTKHMDAARSRDYYLNYYTTEQLGRLRQDLAVFKRMLPQEFELDPQVYALLESVKSKCSKNNIEQAVQSVIRQPKGSLSESSQGIPTQGKEKSTDALPAEDAGKQEIRVKLKQAGYTDILIDSAFENLGEGKEIPKYKRWIKKNHSKLTEKVFQRDKSQKEATKSLIRSIVHDKSLKKQLRELWNDYFITIEKSDLEDCLSLHHVGQTLQKIADTTSLNRQVPEYIKEETLNLIVRSLDNIIPTLISIYKEGNGPLPTYDEILMCSRQTTFEQLDIFWRRALGDQRSRVFCLVRADLLDYKVSVEAEKQLHRLMKEKRGYRIVVLCSDQDESSHIVTALHAYRRDVKVSDTEADDITTYLYKQYQGNVTGLTKEHKLAAGSIAPHGCAVEVIMSEVSGVGKSLQVQRQTEALRDKLKLEERDILNQLCVTVPLHEALVKEFDIMNMLLPHQMSSFKNVPRIFHIDVAPMVRKGLDHFLFMLLVAGGLCDNKGRIWRRNPQDLYIVEITQHLQKEKPTLDLYTLLPRIPCTTPERVLAEYKRPASDIPVTDWQIFDPTVDDVEFRGPVFQIAYQYLHRLDTNQDLDAFEFKHEPRKDLQNRIRERRQKTMFLETLLRHCGINNPTWTELKHFAKFLSVQLQDCQQSLFCNPKHTRGSGLNGFKGFLVKFLIQMSRDFSTPSLEISEENTDGVQDNHQVEANNILPVLKRKWESRPHPYIFFNEDHITFTFLGFYIDDTRRLMDPTSHVPIEDKGNPIMSRELMVGLKKQGVDFSAAKSSHVRLEKLERLCTALGVHPITDPDKTYELTSDNMQKMLAINMKFRCGIPVVVMGETGCGKTRLITFLCRLKVGDRRTNDDEGKKSPQNMLLMKVHGGTTVEQVIRKVQHAEEIAKENKEKFKLDTILFFDEANTTEAIGLIKEIMVDQRVLGTHLDLANGALKMIAACNPYRRHDKETVTRLHKAGLGYCVKNTEVMDKLGSIPLRELVYRVHALPPSVRPLVWDFGQLSDEVEALYIRQIVQRYMNDDLIKITPDQAEIITEVLSESQIFMRSQKSECSFVSLRDVERSLEVLTWFENQPYLNKLLDLKRDKQKQSNEPLEQITRSLVLALGVCYHASLHESRTKYRKTIAGKFKGSCVLHGGPDRISHEISRCQDIFIDEIELEPFIARNNALKENVFMMLVCIELRIPLFLVGRPGSSKSLAKTVLSKSMQGEASGSELFRRLKQVHMISYQCSPLSTPEGIVNTFKQCSRFQGGRDLKHFVSVVVLDEIGLAEDSPKMPLKSLHPLLETGSDDDELDIPRHKKVAFIGISNWALDPAKMNRGIAVSRDEPNEIELIQTARGICCTDNSALERIEPIIPAMAQAYLHVYKNQEKQFFGLRDYYSLIKMIFSSVKKSGLSLDNIVHAVRRNFGGLLGSDDPLKVFKEVIDSDEPLQGPMETSADLLTSSLNGENTPYGESRYLLVLTENLNATLPVLQQQLLREFNASIIFGSSFEFDQEYTQVCKDINRVKREMEAGTTVVLLNMENLYESLYDALNQCYVYFGGQRYVDLGLGTNRFKCRVDQKFRLIVLADKKVVHERFPAPLLNRLEKHFLATDSMLTEAEKEINRELHSWVKAFSEINMTYMGKRSTLSEKDAFVGYNNDMIAALIFQVSMELGQHDGDSKWREEVCNKVKELVLEFATPEAVIRVKRSLRLQHEADTIFNTYFTEQHHRSIKEYLSYHLRIQKAHRGCIMAQVTTHSRVLVREDIETLAKQLQFPEENISDIRLKTFKTQNQFCSRIRDILEECKKSEQILLIQCEDADENNDLIVCAAYCIQDEKKQAEQSAVDAKPAHIVLVNQLPRVHRRFQGFQGGIWEFAHIDDLMDPQPNRPVIASLKGRSVGSLLRRTEDQVVDSTMLMTDGFLDAMSRVSDSVNCRDLGGPRRQLLQRLLREGEENDVDLSFLTVAKKRLNFLTVAKERLADLLDEMDERKGSVGDAWLTSEALNVTEAHRGGTFRRAIWHRLVNIVSPLASELYAFIDYNRNLRTLVDHLNSWQHCLWLAIFADASLSPLHVTDFISPKDNLMRDRAPVKVLGAGDRPFAAKIPFSWLLKESMESKYNSSVEKNATFSQPIAKTFEKQVVSSPWNNLLSNEDVIPCKNRKQFITDYMDDFINMVYRIRATTNEKQEMKCVFEELLQATKEIAKKFNIGVFTNVMGTLVAVHLAYHRLESIFYNFARLVDTTPEVMEIEHAKSLANAQNDKTLDVKVVTLTVKLIQPKDSDLNREAHQKWLNRAKAAKPIIDNVIESVVKGGKDAYEDLENEDFDETRSMWLKISLLILFYERVCSTPDGPDCLFNSASRLWKELDISKPMLKDHVDLQDLEAMLRVFNRDTSKELFGFDDVNEKCYVCHNHLQTPVKLPCGHFVCDQIEGNKCLVLLHEDQESQCPKCNAEIPKDFAPDKKTQQAKASFTLFKQNVNAFFLDVVSLYCFVYNTPPDAEIIGRLVAIVTKFYDEDSEHYKSDIIDPDTVVRSVVLQMLLQTSSEIEKRIKKDLNTYLQAIKVRIDIDSEEIKVVCLLFIQSIENQLYQKAFKEGSLVTLAEKCIKDSTEFLQQQSVEHGQSVQTRLSVQYLEAIAKARFGISITAQCLTAGDVKQNLLFKTTQAFFTFYQHGRHFLVRQICRGVGTAAYNALLQQKDLKQWIAPPEVLTELIEDEQDNFVVCGEPYSTFQEKLAYDMTKSELLTFPEEVQKSAQDQKAAVAFLLAIFREVTCQYAKKTKTIDEKELKKLKGLMDDEEDGNEDKKDIKKTVKLKKEFADLIKKSGEDLLYNKVDSSESKHLTVSDKQTSQDRMLSAMVIHAMQVLRCGKSQPLLKPLEKLLSRPTEMKGTYFPTMPDNLLELQNIVGVGREGITSWLTCPQGHIYGVGNCGRVKERSKCPECGSVIGAAKYDVPADGNKKLDVDKMTFEGHILGSAEHAVNVLETKRLTTTVMTIERAILHATMIGAAITEKEISRDVQHLITPKISDTVHDFLWNHLKSNINQLSAALGKSTDDCFFILHMVLNNMILINPDRCDQKWHFQTTENRDEWEKTFADVYITPVLKDLTARIQQVAVQLEKDDRFKNDPINRILYRQDMKEVTRESLNNLHTFAVAWQYWPRISLKGVQQYLDQRDTASIIDPNAKGPYAILKTFLQEEHILQMIRHLPDIIHLHQLLIDLFNRRIDANEVRKTTIKEFLEDKDSTTKAKHDELRRLVEVFITTWNSVKDTIAGFRFGVLQVPPELCKDIDTSSELAVLLPTNKVPGICSTVLAGLLIRAHNEFMGTYNSIKNNANSRVQPLRASGASHSHLVAFHPDQELLPLVLAHSKYKMESDKGTELTYDLIGIQKQVEDRFIIGRPFLDEKIEQLSFRQDFRNSETFQRIRDKIRQEKLPEQSQQGILEDFRKSFADLCDSVDILDIAIGFVESTNEDGTCFLRKYLADELNLPEDRKIKSLKINEDCCLKHLLSLWHLLVVERAKRMAADDHNPFEGVSEEFCTEPEDKLKEELYNSLKYINADQFVADLYEYIILDLKGSSSDQNISDWSLVDTLYAYVEQKEGDEIRGMMDYVPPQIQVQHAVDTWFVAAKYLAEPRAQHK